MSSWIVLVYVKQQLLPPYSPDLNQIELVYSKLKTLLRQHAERTIASLWICLGKLVEESTAEQCANYFKHFGYQ